MISALPTWFKGTLYRRRLEASWAEFFDTNGFEFQYEPQGFKCSQKSYLCDFLVKLFDRNWCWVEVKPTMDFEKSKIIDFTASTCHLPEDSGYPSGAMFVFVGSPRYGPRILSVCCSAVVPDVEDKWPNCRKEVRFVEGPWQFIRCTRCDIHRFYQFNACRCGFNLSASAQGALGTRMIFSAEVAA